MFTNLKFDLDLVTQDKPTSLLFKLQIDVKKNKLGQVPYLVLSLCFRLLLEKDVFTITIDETSEIIDQSNIDIITEYLLFLCIRIINRLGQAGK